MVSLDSTAVKIPVNERFSTKSLNREQQKGFAVWSIRPVFEFVDLTHFE
jgi:hypothetical protein